MKTILILNGPNLNLLGRRQPEIYGRQSAEDIVGALGQAFPQLNILYMQSNHEGDLIDALHQAGYPEADQPHIDGIILNAGGYTHTSVALADAIAAIPVPVVEVHLSNIYAREDFRHTSLLSPVCAGTISGFGPKVYAMALQALAAE